MHTAGEAAGSQERTFPGALSLEDVGDRWEGPPPTRHTFTTPRGWGQGTDCAKPDEARLGPVRARRLARLDVRMTERWPDRVFTARGRSLLPLFFFFYLKSGILGFSHLSH